MDGTMGPRASRGRSPGRCPGQCPGRVSREEVGEAWVVVSANLGVVNGIGLCSARYTLEGRVEKLVPRTK